jgi:hypothetical protein
MRQALKRLFSQKPGHRQRVGAFGGPIPNESRTASVAAQAKKLPHRRTVHASYCRPSLHAHHHQSGTFARHREPMNDPWCQRDDRLICSRHPLPL